MHTIPWQVYDVTHYVDKHPGGRLVETGVRFQPHSVRVHQRPGRGHGSEPESEVRRGPVPSGRRQSAVDRRWAADVSESDALEENRAHSEPRHR